MVSNPPLLKRSFVPRCQEKESSYVAIRFSELDAHQNCHAAG
jgi:hypothetical protein